MALCGGSGQTSTNTVTNSGAPDWYKNALQSITGQAQGIAQTPYQPYGGNRVAPFTGDTLASFDATRQNVGSWQPATQQAGQLASQSGTSWPQQNIADYTNPYWTQVAQRAGQEAVRQDDIARQSRDASAVGAGSFGGYRQGVVESEAGRNLQQNLSDIYLRGGAEAYDRGQSAYFADQKNKLDAAKTLAGIGQQTSTLGTADAASLGAIGTQQQQQAQTNADVAYQNFQDQTNYPKTNLGWLQGIVTGQNPGTFGGTSTTTATQPAGSGLGQIAGLGLTLAGIGGRNGFGWWGLKRGGPVKRYASGGAVKHFEMGGDVENDYSHLTEGALRMEQIRALSRGSPNELMRARAMGQELLRRRNSATPVPPSTLGSPVANGAPGVFGGTGTLMQDLRDRTAAPAAEDPIVPVDWGALMRRAASPPSQRSTDAVLGTVEGLRRLSNQVTGYEDNPMLTTDAIRRRQQDTSPENQSGQLADLPPSPASLGVPTGDRRNYDYQQGDVPATPGQSSQARQDFEGLRARVRGAFPPPPRILGRITDSLSGLSQATERARSYVMDPAQRYQEAYGPQQDDPGFSLRGPSRTISPTPNDRAAMQPGTLANIRGDYTDQDTDSSVTISPQARPRPVADIGTGAPRGGGGASLAQADAPVTGAPSPAAHASQEAARSALDTNSRRAGSVGDALLYAGLAMMQAASQPGATFLGAAGAGGVSALNHQRDVRRDDITDQYRRDQAENMRQQRELQARGISREEQRDQMLARQHQEDLANRLEVARIAHANAGAYAGAGVREQDAAQRRWLEMANPRNEGESDRDYGQRIGQAYIRTFRPQGEIADERGANARYLRAAQDWRALLQGGTVSETPGTPQFVQAERQFFASRGYTPDGQPLQQQPAAAMPPRPPTVPPEAGWDTRNNTWVTRDGRRFTPDGRPQQ